MTETTITMLVAVMTLLLATAAADSEGGVSNMGPCCKAIEPLKNFNYTEFHTENGGHWKAIYGPGTTFNEGLKSLRYTITPTGIEGQYRDVICYKTKEGKTGILANETVDNCENGVVKATSTDNIVYSISFILYCPGRYAFYYICTENGADMEFDYRYAVAHDELKAEEWDKIKYYDKKYNFKGEFKPIGDCKYE